MRPETASQIERLIRSTLDVFGTSVDQVEIQVRAERWAAVCELLELSPASGYHAFPLSEKWSAPQFEKLGTVPQSVRYLKIRRVA